MKWSVEAKKIYDECEVRLEHSLAMTNTISFWKITWSSQCEQPTDTKTACYNYVY